jgi:hypothetical protein
MRAYCRGAAEAEKATQDLDLYDSHDGSAFVTAQLDVGAFHGGHNAAITIDAGDGDVWHDRQQAVSSLLSSRSTTET